ncbi:collagen binding domain-containing protein [Natrialbaceae archaeon A-CW2]
MRSRNSRLGVVALTLVLCLAAVAGVPFVLGMADADATLSVDSNEAGEPAEHTWELTGVDFEGEVDEITLQYPEGASFDGVTNEDVTVEIQREGETEPTEISVNSDSYAGDTATLDLSGVFNTDVDGPVIVTVADLRNPPEGDHEATLTLEGADDSLSVSDAFETEGDYEVPEPPEAEATLALEPTDAGESAVHTWTLSAVDFGDDEIETITVEYPDGTDFDGVTNDDVTVEIDRTGDGERTEISVNSDSYDGERATFDLSGVFNTNVGGDVVVAIDGLENPPAGDYAASITLTSEDRTKTLEAPFETTADAEPVLEATVFADGGPYANEPVVLELEGTVAFVTTDEDGVVTVDVPATGSYGVTVTSQGDGTATDTVSVDGQTGATFDLTRAESGAFEATVADEDGDPLPDGTLVTFSGDDGFGPDRTGQLEDGSVHITGVEPGSYEITAETDDLGMTDPVSVEVTAAETTAVSVGYGDEQTALEGSVRTPDGTVLADELVALELFGDDDRVELLSTDEDGAFALEDIEPGEYELAVTGQGFDTSESVSVGIEAGETASVELVLADSAPGAFEATVTDEDGDPLRDGTFVTFSGDDGFGPDRTGQIEDGSVRITGVEPGTYAVTATTTELGSTEPVTLDIGAETTEATFSYRTVEDVDTVVIDGTTATESLEVGSVEGDVIVTGAATIEDELLIRGDVGGDVVLSGGSTVGDLTVEGDVDGGVLVTGFVTVDRLTVVGSVGESVELRGASLVREDLSAGEIDDDLTLQGVSTVGGDLTSGAVGGDVSLQGVPLVRGDLTIETLEGSLERRGNPTVGGDIVVDGEVSEDSSGPSGPGAGNGAGGPVFVFG